MSGLFISKGIHFWEMFCIVLFRQVVCKKNHNGKGAF